MPGFWPSSSALPALSAAAGYYWWSRGLPQLAGDLRLKGLGAEVRVIRDAHGVPHIFAADLKDAARTLGYLHAQDRFFQMDITRRVTQGRLAEIIGKRGLAFDRLFRTLDLAGSAQKSFAALSPEMQAYLQAYADGVNAWLAESGQALPIEYTVLGFKAEPWRPQDSLTWGKTMAWKLSANWRQDAARARLAARYGVERTERLFPRNFDDFPITLQPDIPRGPARGAALRPDPASRMLPSLVTHGLTPSASAADALLGPLLTLPSIGAGASNEWVIDGTRTSDRQAAAGQ